MNRKSKFIPAGNNAMTQIALDKQRAHWESLLVMVMHKAGLKELIVDDDLLKSLAAAVPPQEIAYLITLRADQVKNGGRFGIVVAYGKAEHDKILSDLANVGAKQVENKG